MMTMNNNMSEVEVKSKKKRMNKARICGKGLTKGEADENTALHKRSLAEVNIEFGK